LLTSIYLGNALVPFGDVFSVVIHVFDGFGNVCGILMDWNQTGSCILLTYIWLDRYILQY